MDYKGTTSLRSVVPRTSPALGVLSHIYLVNILLLFRMDNLDNLPDDIKRIIISQWIKDNHTKEYDAYRFDWWILYKFVSPVPFKSI